MQVPKYRNWLLKYNLILKRLSLFDLKRVETKEELNEREEKNQIFHIHLLSF